MKTVKLSRTLTAGLALLLALCLSLPLTACGGAVPDNGLYYGVK